VSDAHAASRTGSHASAGEHPNAARIRALFAAFKGADLATVQATIPEDAVWHFPGRRGKLAGAHRGRQAILQFLMAVQQLTDGTFHLDLEHVLADDAHAVAFFRGHGTRGDKTLDNPTCLRMRIVDGKVVEVWEFVWDLFAVDDFWS
jgi:ketosteroid isomerase-like protein